MVHSFCRSRLCSYDSLMSFIGDHSLVVCLPDMRRIVGCATGMSASVCFCCFTPIAASSLLLSYRKEVCVEG